MVSDFGDQLAEYDDRLFNRMCRNLQLACTAYCRHPSAASQNCDLRPRRHDRQLPGHASHLMECDFITRVLYKELTNKTVDFCVFSACLLT